MPFALAGGPESVTITQWINTYGLAVAIAIIVLIGGIAFVNFARWLAVKYLIPKWVEWIDKQIARMEGIERTNQTISSDIKELRVRADETHSLIENHVIWRGNERRTQHPQTPAPTGGGK